MLIFKVYFSVTFTLPIFLCTFNKTLVCALWIAQCLAADAFRTFSFIAVDVALRRSEVSGDEAVLEVCCAQEGTSVLLALSNPVCFGELVDGLVSRKVCDFPFLRCLAVACICLQLRTLCSFAVMAVDADWVVLQSDGNAYNLPELSGVMSLRLH